VILPHDGQPGAGAASARIETARRYFSRIFFNADITERGRDALGWYHEKRSNVWLGQNHDWSSHGRTVSA
jgi:phage terminase large subunit